MPALSTAQRNAVTRGLMRHFSLNRELTAFQKATLSQIVVDLDDWLTTNETNINNAIGQPGRNEATTSQKAFILAVLVAMRDSTTTAKKLVDTD